MTTLIDFSKKKCLPCEGMGKVMSKQEAAEQFNNLPGWVLADDGKSMERAYVLKNFAQGVDKINRIKDIAESEGHHPDLHLTGFKNLKVVLSTHALGGITENDFIVAAKINQLG